MTNRKTITIDYLARVEGEAALLVHLGDAAAVTLKIFEPPRFFEGFLVGRQYDEVADIVARICGICPVSHLTTALQAVENAMGVKVSPQTKALRSLLCLSQTAASHLIHLVMLAMPDYYGYSGIVAMRPGFSRHVTRLLQMKEVLNELTALIGGRALHPVTAVPGGFTAAPPGPALAGSWKNAETCGPWPTNWSRTWRAFPCRSCTATLNS